MTISAEEPQRLVLNQPSSMGSSSTTLSQTSSSVACIESSLSSTPWVIDSGASDHRIDTVLSYRQSIGNHLVFP